MAATIRMSYYGASAGEPAGATAETGITFSLSDAKAPAASVSPITKPATTGTNYSWIMLLALEVTGTAATTINNRKIRFASAVTAGLQSFWGDQATYRRPAAGSLPTASGSNGPATPTPAGAGAPGSYTAFTTSLVQFDNTSVSAGSTGRNGHFAELVFGVDSSYAGGGGAATLPNIEVSYDES